MVKHLNWNNAKTYRGSEAKYDEGLVLGNGTVIHKPLDRMAVRARAAEREWLRKNGMQSIYDRAPKTGRKKQKRPSKTIYRPALFEDVVMDVLNGKGK